MNKSPKEEQAAHEEQRFDELAENPSDRPDMETEKRTIVQNKDNGSLLPSVAGKYIFGSAEEVNRAGAEEITGYTPTKHELIQLVQFWYRELLGIHWKFFFSCRSGSYEARLGAFARRRIDRAEAMIGKEAVDQAIKEVRDKFKAKLDDARLWADLEYCDPEDLAHAKCWSAPDR